MKLNDVFKALKNPQGKPPCTFLNTEYLGRRACVKYLVLLRCKANVITGSLLCPANRGVEMGSNFGTNGS